MIKLNQVEVQVSQSLSNLQKPLLFICQVV